MSKKYRVDTDKGSFIVETDEGNSPEMSSGMADRERNSTAQSMNMADREKGAPEPSRLDKAKKFLFGGEMQEPIQAPNRVEEPSIVERGLGALHNAVAPYIPSMPHIPGLGYVEGALEGGIPGGPATEGMGIVSKLANSPLGQLTAAGASKLGYDADTLLSKAASLRKWGDKPIAVKDLLTTSVGDLAKTALAKGPGHRVVARGLEEVGQTMASMEPPTQIPLENLPGMEMQTKPGLSGQLSHEIEPNEAIKGMEAERLRNQIPDLEMKPAPGPAREIPFPGYPEPTPTPTPDIAAQIQNVEEGLRPRGKIAKTRLAGGTPKKPPAILQEMPELGTIPPGPEFDTALHKGFLDRQGAIDILENQVPRETTVPKQPILDAWEALKQEYADRGLVKSTRTAEKLIAKWKELDSAIPWDTFLGLKRGFFKEMASLDSGTARRLYGPLMEATNGISPELAQANKSYSIVRKEMDGAGIHLESGRRIWGDKPAPQPPPKGMTAEPGRGAFRTAL